MGNESFIKCKDCNIVRDLGKNFSHQYKIEDEEMAIEMQEDIKNGSFSVGLLVTFLMNHKTHNCILFTEQDEELYDDISQNTIERDIDYFKKFRTVWER